MHNARHWRERDRPPYIREPAFVVQLSPFASMIINLVIELYFTLGKLYKSAQLFKRLCVALQNYKNKQSTKMDYRHTPINLERVHVSNIKAGLDKKLNVARDEVKEHTAER